MPKIESWQIYHVALKHLSPGYLQKIYTRSTRLIYFWAADPRTTSRTERNPLDRIRDMLDALDDIGKGDYARAAIDYLAEPLGGRFTDKKQAESDKGTIDGELADICIALGKLGDKAREAVKDGKIDAAEKIQLKEGARTIKREVEQFLDAVGINGKL